MANCINYNCTELPDHVQNDCNSILKGGVDAVIVLECGHSITDPSNATQINDAITAGKATLIEAVKYSVEAASPIEIDSDVACQAPRTINYDRAGTYLDANVSDINIDFYNELNDGRNFGGLILHECDADEITWIDDAVRFSGSRVIPNDNNDRQRFEGGFKWKSLVEGSIRQATKQPSPSPTHFTFITNSSFFLTWSTNFAKSSSSSSL